MMMGTIMADAKRARSLMRFSNAKKLTNTGAGKFVRKHKLITAGLLAGPGYGAVSGFRNSPGPERSLRNQEDDPYLRRVRAHQQSTLFARSMGGMTL